MVPIGEPLYLLDEIDNQNPAILHNDNETYTGYRLGLPSLVTHEQTDQHAIGFGFAGYQPQHPNGYAKAFLEVPHSISYSFQSSGSFSVEFLFYKKYLLDEAINHYPVYRPIISKEGVFDIYFSITASKQSIIVSTPVGNITIPLQIKTSYSLINSVNHFVLTWGVAESDTAIFNGTANVYINGYLAESLSQEYFDTFPITDVNSPILIAGRIGSNIRNDWHTSDFQIDQIAIYDKALSSEVISKHASKIFPYDILINKHFAESYWPFDEQDSLVTKTVYDVYGSKNGTYLGVNGSHFVRNVSGPSNIMQSKSAEFRNGGMASIINITNQGKYIPREISSEYSYEGWFLSGVSNRSILFAAQELEWPFNGACLQLNMKDNLETPGSIQYSEGNNGVVLNSQYLDTNNARLMFNDGKWHHFVVLRRTDGYIELWLDGELHSSSLQATRDLVSCGQLLVMNSIPGNLHCNGRICKLAYYPYALQKNQIVTHFTYTTTYRIRGIVTLLGVPYRATLRFYNSYTGQLLQELQSDPNTGEYEAIFYSNAGIDILVFSPADLSVRYRAYGPVTPSEFIDMPVDL